MPKMATHYSVSGLPLLVPVLTLVLARVDFQVAAVNT